MLFPNERGKLVVYLRVSGRTLRVEDILLPECEKGGKKKPVRREKSAAEK